MTQYRGINLHPLTSFDVKVVLVKPRQFFETRFYCERAKFIMMSVGWSFAKLKIMWKLSIYNWHRDVGCSNFDEMVYRLVIRYICIRQSIVSFYRRLITEYGLWISHYQLNLNISSIKTQSFHYQRLFDFIFNFGFCFQWQKKSVMDR